MWVNGSRIPPANPFLLHQGDSVQLGVPLDGNPVEFDYTLVQKSYNEVKSFLSGNLDKESGAAPVGQKLKNSKRKLDRGDDESEPSPTNQCKSKLYRCSGSDKSRAQPCPSGEHRETVKFSSKPLEEDRCGDAAGSSSSASTEKSQQLASVHRYSKSLMVLKSRVGDTQKRAAELERLRDQTPEREREMQEREMQELQTQLERLRGQLRSQKEQALKRIECLEKSFCEEERRLEVSLQHQRQVKTYYLSVHTIHPKCYVRLE